MPKEHADTHPNRMITSVKLVACEGAAGRASASPSNSVTGSMVTAL